MHALICITIPTLMIFDILRLELSLPRPLLLLPELLAGIALILALRAFASNRKLMIGPGFAIWFTVMLLFLTLGLIASEASAGPTVGGLRFYLKYLPFFLIPIVHQFSERELKFQMQLILGVCLLQAPVALLQRFVWYVSSSGDQARGTFATGSMGSTFLMMTLAVLVACYYKKRISLAQLLICGTLMFIPISIGEVKGAFILLPLALVIPALMMPDGKSTGRKLARGGLPAIAALFLFATVYSLVESNFRPKHELGLAEHRTSIVAFFTDPDIIIRYLAPRQRADGDHQRSGRIDDVIAAVSRLSEDPIKLVTGLGMGAVTEAPIDAFSTDQHSNLVDEGVVGSSISVILWELGVLGLLLVFIGACMVWRAAKASRHDPGIVGAIGLGWLAAMPLLFIAFFWKNFLGNDPITAAFAYFTGHVLASAYRQRTLQLMNRTGTSAPQTGNSLNVVLEEADNRLPSILQSSAVTR